MIIYKRATTDEELVGIQQLQQANLPDPDKVKEQENQGFCNHST